MTDDDTFPGARPLPVSTAADGPAAEHLPAGHDADADRIEARAQLLPEEAVTGASDDAELQAQVILEDSDRRTEAPEATKRESTQTPD